MRIISGQFRGRRLFVPRTGLRPTQDLVRGAVFSALGAMIDLEGLYVLDLYAGTGAFGFEALSRGAAFAAFIEKDRAAAAAIVKNARELQLDQSLYRVLNADVFFALRNLRSHPFNLIFADPPYDDPCGEQLVTEILRVCEFAPDAIVAYEDNGRSKLPEKVEISGNRALLVKRKTYGETVVSYFRLHHSSLEPSDEEQKS